MKIVLLKDVKGQGKKGDIIEASEGYARNYLLPRKIGVEATPDALNTLKLQKANAERIAAEQLAQAQEMAGRLASVTVNVSMKGGEGGRTFGSVSTKEIADLLKEQCGIDIDKKKLVLDEPIKAFGTYQVGVKLHKDVTGTLNVKVTEL